MPPFIYFVKFKNGLSMRVNKVQADLYIYSGKNEVEFVLETNNTTNETSRYWPIS